MAWLFEPLGRRHDRADFQSASPALSTYLQQLARKDAERHIAAVFVMVNESAPSKIVGYYTLSAFTVEVEELPAAQQKKFPPVSPVARHVIRSPGAG